MLIKTIFFDIETTGLNPFEDRIALISVSDGANIVDIDGRDEQAAIKKLIDLSYGGVLIGYNIKGFDLPFITTRAIIHGMPSTVLSDIHKCYKIDLMQFVRNYMLTNKYGKHSLQYIHTVLTGKEFDDKSGEEVVSYAKDYLSGDDSAIEDVKIHCHCDIQRLIDLFYRFYDLLRLYFYRKYGFFVDFHTGWLENRNVY